MNYVIHKMCIMKKNYNNKEYEIIKHKIINSEAIQQTYRSI